MNARQQRFVTEYLIDLNATQAAIRAGYSRKTAQQQGSRLLTNVVVKRAIAAQQDQQLKSVEVRIQDVLHDLRAIAHTDLQTLTEQSGVPARWGDKLKALELLDEASRSRGPRDPSARPSACAFHAGAI